MNIPYPDEKRISEAVQSICDQAVPEQETVRSFLKKYDPAWARNIFRGPWILHC